MTDFQLDTSGVVSIPNADPYGPAVIVYTWTSLNAFQQGFTAAAANSLSIDDLAQLAERHDGRRFAVRFSDFAPSALELILKDCAAVSDWKSLSRMGFVNGADGGRQFWDARQAGKWAFYRPLDVTLGDDGKIYLEPKA